MADVCPVARPTQWHGTLFQDTHKYGPSIRRVRQALATQAGHTLPIKRLVKIMRMVGSDREPNVVNTLETMERIGDVTLTRRDEKIRRVTLFNYSSIDLDSAGS